MGSLTYGFESANARAIVHASWAAVPAVLFAFVLSRYVLTGPVPLFVAQVIYVGAAIASCVGTGIAASRARGSGRGALVWGLLSTSLGLLAASEAVYAWVLLTDGAAGMVNTGLADYLNAAAAIVFIAMLATAASVERVGGLAAARVVVDLLAICALSFTVLFRVSVVGIAATGGTQQIFDAVRYAVYASIGFVILAGDGLLLVSMPWRRLQPWDRLLALGIAIFGAGVTFWPVWYLAFDGASVPWLVEATVSTLYLLGYALMTHAALQRILATEVPWRDWTGRRSAPAWLGLSVTTAVFGSVLILGTWAVLAPSGHAEEYVYLIALLVAAISMLVRTFLGSVENARMQVRAWTDDTTRLGNVHALKWRVAELTAASHRREAPFALAIVDIDGFSAINDSWGSEHGDRLLAAVGAALSACVGEPGHVYRLGGDEFAVLWPSATLSSAEGCGHALAEAVAEVSADHRLSVSVGVACCPAHASDTEGLIRAATIAVQWVKRHGGAAVALYDEHLKTASLDVSLGAEGGSGIDMARALSAAADVRDPANHHHSRNVSALAILVAGELGFEQERCARLQVAAMLHDVGKIALPDTMLGGRLVAIKQRRTEQEHCAMGQRLLESLRLEGVPLWVRAHHERWDGQGFPDGLHAEQIPLEARIIALADAYDGMTAGKRYGAPMSKAAALQEIDLGIGARFDPVLAETFIQIVGTTSALGWADGWPAA